MAHANNIITAPVDVYGDIAALFGIASGDVGYLIANANINKWAKYKPMGGSSPASLTDADRVALNQGFKVTASGTDYDSIFCSGAEGAFLIAKQNAADWNYIHNNLTWYRVTDFVPYNASSSTPYAGNGYVHGVANPFVKVGTSHVHNVTSSIWQCGLQFYYYARTGGIALTDLKVFNDKGAGTVNPDATWYWGVVYCVGGTYGYSFCTTTQGGSTLVPVGTPSDPNNGVGIDGYYEIPVSSTTTSVEIYLVAISRVNQTGGVQGFIYIPTIYDADWNLVTYVSPTATVALNWWTAAPGTPLRALTLQYSSSYLVYVWLHMQIVVNDAAWGTAGVGGTAYVTLRKKSTGQTASQNIAFTPSNFSTDSNNNHVCVLRFDDYTSPMGSDPHNPISTSLFATGDLSDIEIGFYINITTGGSGTAYYDGFGNRVQVMTYSDLYNTAGTSVMDYLTSRNYQIVNI